MAIEVIDESGKSDETNAAGKIEVEGKSYSAEDVQNLVKMQASATQTMQEVAEIKAAAEKYGVDVETYLGQAEGAFGVMSQLIADKVINLPAGEGKAPAGIDKIAAIVAKALGPQLESIEELGKRVAAVDKTQGDMIRLNLEEKVTTKFPNLKPNDISQVFGAAMQDRTKSLWEHAEAASKAKASSVSSLREEHAKEFGIDLSKFDENKLKEQKAGGGAGVLFEGKKFSFNPKKGDKDSVTPAKAAAEYIESLSS